MPKKKAKKASASKKKKKAPSAKAAAGPVALTMEETLHQALRRTRWWLIENKAVVSKYIKDWGSEDMTIDDFHVALRYLQFPVNSAQFNLLVKCLDQTRSGNISLKDFTGIELKSDQDLLRIAYTTSLVDPMEDQEEGEEIRGKKKKKKGGAKKEEVVPAAKNDVLIQQGEPCKKCNITLIEPPMEYRPKYVKVQLTLATFKELQHYPGHFTVTLTTSTTIHGLIDIIKTHLGRSVMTVAVFSHHTCGKDNYLNPLWTLEHCGLEGSPVKYTPNNYQLYYDFIPDFIHCPILMADNAIRDVPPIIKKKL